MHSRTVPMMLWILLITRIKNCQSFHQLRPSESVVLQASLGVSKPEAWQPTDRLFRLKGLLSSLQRWKLPTAANCHLVVHSLFFPWGPRRSHRCTTPQMPPLKYPTSICFGWYQWVAPESPCKELNPQTACIVEISPHSDYVGCMQRDDPWTSKQKVDLPSKIWDSLTLPVIAIPVSCPRSVQLDLPRFYTILIWTVIRSFCWTHCRKISR